MTVKSEFISKIFYSMSHGVAKDQVSAVDKFLIK